MKTINLLDEHVILETVRCNPNDKESIIEALSLIQDEDMNGGNGDEYLWEVAKENNCETNLDYLIKLLRESNKTSVNELTELYLDTWLNGDSYYVGYKYCYNVVGDTAIISVVIVNNN